MRTFLPNLQETAQKCVVSFQEFLNEYRLIYLGIDKFGIICYTLLTVKKGDIKNESNENGKTYSQ